MAVVYSTSEKISLYFTTSGYYFILQNNGAISEGVSTSCADICNQWMHVVV